MAFHNFRRVLAISAHPDDADLGCGGTLVKAARAGAVVHACVMSRCADETPKGAENLRVDEFLAAARVLGIKKTHVFDFRNRELPSQEIEMLERFAEIQESVKPDLVLIPWTDDSHQDHASVGLAAVRSFRRKETILQYEILRYGSHSFTPNLFVDISDSIEKKLEALSSYRSQFRQRAYFDRESFQGLARTRGAQVGFNYAEGFLGYKVLW